MIHVSRRQQSLLLKPQAWSDLVAAPLFSTTFRFDAANFISLHKFEVSYMFAWLVTQKNPYGSILDLLQFLKITHLMCSRLLIRRCVRKQSSILFMLNFTHSPEFSYPFGRINILQDLNQTNLLESLTQFIFVIGKNCDLLDHNCCQFNLQESKQVIDLGQIFLPTICDVVFHGNVGSFSLLFALLCPSRHRFYRAMHSPPISGTRH